MNIIEILWVRQVLVGGKLLEISIKRHLNIVGKFWIAHVLGGRNIYFGVKKEKIGTHLLPKKCCFSGRSLLNQNCSIEGRSLRVN